MLKFFMKNFLGMSLALSLIVCPGCSFFKPKKNIVQPPPPVILNGKIIQKERVAEGGRLLIVPFSPGETVEANAEFERVSLMIVKGVIETLQRQETPFTVLDDATAHTADLILKGRMLRMQERRVFKSWFRKKTVGKLSVEGMMIDRDTGDVLARFSADKSGADDAGKLDALGYAVGRDIGQLLLSELK